MNQPPPLTYPIPPIIHNNNQCNGHRIPGTNETIYNSDIYKIISRENNKNGRELDVACKNKWNWSWLEEKDVNGDFISGYIRKIDTSGLAFGIYSNNPVNYGSPGKKDILAPARKSPNHLCNKKDYH